MSGDPTRFVFCQQGAPGPVGPLGPAGPSGEKVRVFLFFLAHVRRLLFTL